ncbi:MAG: cytochrome b N-terminal domain-containing protein [Rhodovibrionaceae bacterium]|nr:cytochrome b N-terminal domain-containing protein [Rhodovibrionaceae bacterium]
MEIIRSGLRQAFFFSESWLARVFPASWNPLLNLGALGFFFYWVVAVSGVYVYIFFDTGVEQAYESIEYMTYEQWYLAGVMRSLHRYASDALVLVMVLHLAREFANDRYRGARWFSWVTGIPVMILVFLAGITGYWLVWDVLAQYVAEVSTEWLDSLGLFGEPVARNFMAPDALEGRFFTLMIFMHIAVPLLALGLLWLHLQRIAKPKINPPRGLAFWVFGSMLAMSLIYPAESQGPANLARVPGEVGLDWFYLPLFPLLDSLPGPVTWSAAGVLLVIAVAIPWLPPMRRPAIAEVDLANCNGCTRCFEDCPFNAITMVPRSDGRAFDLEPIVNPANCVSCGICAGSCPTSMPFRRMSELSPGIDLPDRSIAQLRAATEEAAAGLKGDSRLIVFGCDYGAAPHLRNQGTGEEDEVALVSLVCVGQLPPAFIDFVLSRDLADGVVLAGCAENGCHARLGLEWTQQRLAGERDPYLRERVPRERLRCLWLNRIEGKMLRDELARFRKDLARIGADDG